MWEASGSAYLRLLCTSACVTLPASRRTKESWVFHDLCDDGELAWRILLRGNGLVSPPHYHRAPRIQGPRQAAASLLTVCCAPEHHWYNVRHVD